MCPVSRAAAILLLGLLAACQYVRPSPVGTNCVHYGRNPMPVCTN
ncbi:hypothetical protein [Roseicella aquatilis]|nr:hypothetical protein [Roseicella aquatilis]